jgi:hypothetical protein
MGFMGFRDLKPKAPQARVLPCCRAVEGDEVVVEVLPLPLWWKVFKQMPQELQGRCAVTWNAAGSSPALPLAPPD